MISYVEHLFIRFLAICISSLVRLVQIFFLFLNWFVCFLIPFWRVLCICWIQVQTCFANISSQSVVCLLTPLQEKVFNLNKVQLTSFFFYGSLFLMETPILWPPDAKSWLIWKDPDAGKDWGQEEKGMTEDEMVGWHHRLNGHWFGWTPGVGDG